MTFNNNSKKLNISKVILKVKLYFQMIKQKDRAIQLKM